MLHRQIIVDIQESPSGRTTVNIQHWDKTSDEVLGNQIYTTHTPGMFKTTVEIFHTALVNCVTLFRTIGR